MLSTSPIFSGLQGTNLPPSGSNGVPFSQTQTSIVFDASDVPTDRSGVKISVVPWYRDASSGVWKQMSGRLEILEKHDDRLQFLIPAHIRQIADRVYGEVAQYIKAGSAKVAATLYENVSDSSLESNPNVVKMGFAATVEGGSVVSSNLDDTTQGHFLFTGAGFKFGPAFPVNPSGVIGGEISITDFGTSNEIQIKLQTSYDGGLNWADVGAATQLAKVGTTMSSDFLPLVDRFKKADLVPMPRTESYEFDKIRAPLARIAMNVDTGTGAKTKAKIYI